MFPTTQYDWVRASIQAVRRVAQRGTTTSGSRYRGRRLQFDALEDRRLLAVVPTRPAIDIPDDGGAQGEALVSVESTQGATIDLNVAALQRNIPVSGPSNVDLVDPKILQMQNVMNRPGPSSVFAVEIPGTSPTTFQSLARPGNSSAAGGADGRQDPIVCFAFDPHLMVSNQGTTAPLQPM